MFYPNLVIRKNSHFVSSAIHIKIGSLLFTDECEVGKRGGFIIYAIRADKALTKTSHLTAFRLLGLSEQKKPAQPPEEKTSK